MARNKVPKESNPVSGTDNLKPTSGVGFRFTKTYGAKLGAMENINYRAAEIYSQGDKWYVYYHYRNPITGKMQRFKVYEDINRIADMKKRMAFAELLRDAVNLALKEGFNPFKIAQQRPSKQWTFIQALNYWKQSFEDSDLRKKTTQNYITFYNFYVNFPDKHLLVKDITPARFEAYMVSLMKQHGWSNTTFNNKLNSASVFFSFCVEKGWCETNIVKKVKRRKEVIKKHQAFTREQFDKMLAHLEANDKDLYWWCRFIYFTATRPKSETRMLQVRHVLYERKLLFIPGKISKNKQDDYIPLADELLVWLEGMRHKNKEWYIFGGPKPIGENTMAARFKLVREKLGMPAEVTIYGFKHTRALHLAEAGVSPYEIMALFRHSGLDVTMKYLRDIGANISREAVDVK